LKYFLVNFKFNKKRFNMNTDYIPQSDGKFLEWVKFLFTYLQVHASEWNIAPDTYAPILVLVGAYELAYAKATDPNHGHADTLAKDEARDILKKAVRQYVKEYLANNHLVSDEERRHMALPVHDTVRTPASSTEDAPVGEVDFSRHQQHTMHVKSGTFTGKSKPPHVRGYELWRKIGNAPTKESDWEYVGFSSRSAFVVKYAQEQVGLTVHYRYRWLNMRNQPGPWCEGYVSAVIG
jgi:hypothetical protein